MVKYCRELFSLCIRQPSVFAQHAREIWGLTTKISLLNFPPILRMGNIYLKIGEIWGLTTKISLLNRTAMLRQVIVASYYWLWPKTLARTKWNHACTNLALLGF